MLHKLLVLIHLVGFASYLGAGFAQHQFMSRSAAGGMAAAVRDEYERLSSAIVTAIELPSLVVQIATGVTFLVLTPAWLTQGWLHAKLGCVLVLLVLSHLEMFNARKIVKARAARGETASAEVAPRKARHRMFGTLGSAAVVLLICLVAYGTG
jgi:protoporphyrinogen IX oxidase